MSELIEETASSVAAIEKQLMAMEPGNASPNRGDVWRRMATHKIVEISLANIFTRGVPVVLKFPGKTRCCWMRSQF